MKKKWEVFSKIILFSTIFFVVFSLCFSHQSNALVYQKDAQIGFTVNEIINVTLSGNLSISDLVPGGQKDSNSISVTVRTNGALGYTLSATAGSTTNNSTDLVLDASNKISSISTSANLSTLSTDNTWGYRLSDDNSTWGNYNGLALVGGTATVLKDTSSMPTGGTDITYFKIGAKASSELAVGSYTNKVTFYAVAKTTPTSTTPYMQDIVEWADTLDVNESMQVKDARDDKIYWVTRLADGNIWMTQNLDLDLSTSITLTSADSDVTANWTPQNDTKTDSAGSWSSSNNSAFSYDPGDNYIPSGTGSATSTASLASNSTDLHYHQGNYYNWYAATAGSDASTMSRDDEATQSICPKGWRLPYGTQANKSWYYMLSTSISGYGSNAATSQAMHISPFYIPYAGAYGGSSVSYVGSIGYYKSSTAYGSSYTYTLRFNSSSVSHKFNSPAGGGGPVRCVSRHPINTISEVSTMQEFGEMSASEKNNVLSSMTTNTQYQLTDSRDGKKYWVAKLADGNIWMTQNLDFVISSTGTTLYPASSDVTTNRTLGTTIDWDDDDMYNFYEGGDYYLPSGSSTITSSSNLASDSTNLHYHVGNYYSWTAATANTGSLLSAGSEAPESICPRGWRLPTTNSTTNQYSFGTILTDYNYSSSSDSILLNSPLYYTRAGLVMGGNIEWRGGSMGMGSFWSNLVAESANGHRSAYELSFDSGSVTVASKAGQNLGLNVRCVAR